MKRSPKKEKCVCVLTIIHGHLQKKFISRLRSISSCGSDAFPPILFIRLKHCPSLPLALVYFLGVVPTDWLTALIVPVFKKGTAGDLANYLPISITCVPSKIMERIITCKILNHLYLHNIIPAQHGFLRRHSTSN